MNAMNPARRGAALLAGLLLTLSARSSQPLGAERAVGLCAGQCAGAREGVRMGSRLQDFALAMRLRGSGDVASHVGAGASAEGGGAGGACAVADAGDRESEREKKKRASVLSNTIFLRGLPAFANEEWIAILIGRTSVATDEQSGARKVYIYRDEHGTPTGSCVVGLVSVEEALRVEAALNGKSMEGDAGWFTLRARVVPRRRAKPAPLPAGWQRFTDEETQREYYYNTATGKTQWDAPPVNATDPALGSLDQAPNRTSTGRYTVESAGGGGGEQLASAAGPALPAGMGGGGSGGAPSGWTGFVPQTTREVPGGYISSSGTFLPRLPRGSKEVCVCVCGCVV